MKINLITITGKWEAGFVLDKHVDHSEFLRHNEFGHTEYNTVRTEVGEAIFKLKYRSDLTQINPLAKKMADIVKVSLPLIGFVVPMPPSKTRAIQPLEMLAKKVAEFLEVPFFKNILFKNATTPQMKDIDTIEEKIAVLMGCFHINETITNEGKWDVLIIDDLYSSGASLSAATQTLKAYNKVNNIYAVAFSRTK